jgi:hypothetical protein
MAPETITIDQLAAAIAGKITPSIPINVALWDAETIGKFLHVSAAYVKSSYAPLPDFPKAHRLPSANGKGHPRWKAIQVIEWANKYQEGEQKGRKRGAS